MQTHRRVRFEDGHEYDVVAASPRYEICE